MAFVTTNPNNPFIVTLYDPQNVVTSATGGTGALTDSVDALLNYVNTNNAALAINAVSAFTGTSITFNNNINMSNAGINYNGSTWLTSNSFNTINGNLQLNVAGINVATLTQGLMTVAGDVNASNFVTASDRRLKTDIRPYEPAGLPTPVRFRWAKSGQEDIGVIADNALEIEPLLVTRSKEGTQQVNYSKLVVLCLAELGALRTEVSSLRAQLSTCMAVQPSTPL